jgi:hypothetical protein
MTGVFKLWVYLSTTPLLWLTATLVAYVVADGPPGTCAGTRSPTRFSSRSSRSS